jgi:hypothetical protein
MGKIFCSLPMDIIRHLKQKLVLTPQFSDTVALSCVAIDPNTKAKNRIISLNLPLSSAQATDFFKQNRFRLDPAQTNRPSTRLDMRKGPFCALVFPDAKTQEKRVYVFQKPLGLPSFDPEQTTQCWYSPFGKCFNLFLPRR